MTIMQIPKATETLRTHNAWRRGNDESIQATDPTELGIAIDTVLESHAEILDLLCDCAGQFLISHDDGTLSHSYMSTEERLCAYLVAAGRMEVVSRGKFRFVDANTPISRNPHLQDSDSFVDDALK